MKYFLCVLFWLLQLQVFGQARDSSIWTPPTPDHYAFIHYNENAISQAGRLDSVFRKLVRIHAIHKGTLNIIHIGDSHLQADGITSVLRNGFQAYFGDAGRGLVFPYQLAGTNAPHDVHASSNVSWKSGRLTNTEPTVNTGICGYGIQCNQKRAYVRLSLSDPDNKQSYFNRMVFFLGNETAIYKLTDTNIAEPATLNTIVGKDTPSVVYNSDSLLTGFELTRMETTSQRDFSFYGVSLERRGAPGVLYHTIGVNGARYDQFAANDLIWSQLSALHGDLFIVSLGTNEAQNQHVNELGIMAACDEVVRRIHTIAPRAIVLITTPAGSYYKMKRPNASMQNVADAFVRYCQDKRLPCWDLYKISGGRKGTMDWNNRDLISNDLVHYNQQGYRVQGQLLLDAFAKAYNTYEKAHPYKSEPIGQPVVVVRKGQPIRKPPAHSKQSDVIPPANKPATETGTKATAVDSSVQLPPVTPKPHKSNIKISYQE